MMEVNELTRKVNTLKVYCCGGTGSNVYSLLSRVAKAGEGFANVELVRIDTSKANLGRDLDLSNTYLFKDLDGSGSIRATNATTIAESARDILVKHKPADYNVVLSSGGGGRRI